MRNKSRFIATPEVAKHRIFVWVKPELLCNQQTLVFARNDDYFFGVLHSRAHELWARATGTQLREAESGFRYTPTTCFETFPFPWPPGKEPGRGEAFAKVFLSIDLSAMAALLIDRVFCANASPLQREQAIANAARELVQLREAQSGPRTLTQLYNERPTWLDNAHRKLDAAVFTAYGWPPDLNDDEVLARLLALNLARATG